MPDKDLNEQRKSRRRSARIGTFAALRPHFARLGQVIDINRDGLAFQYIADGEQTTGEFELDLFMTDNGFRLSALPCHVVYDVEMQSNLLKSFMASRRCGVRFGRLTESQRSMLEHFLSLYAAD